MPPLAESAQLSFSLFADSAEAGKTFEEVSGDISFERHRCFIEITQLDILPRKFLDAAYLIASRGPKGQSRYTVSKKFIEFLMRYNSHDYNSFKNAAAAVRRGNIEYSDQLPGEDFTEKNRWGNTAYLSAVDIDKGLVSFEVPLKLLPLVQDPTTSDMLSLRICSKFNTVLGRTIYDRCLPFLKEGRTPWYSLAEVQRWCVTLGDSLKEFKSFNRGRLKPALEEINAVSDLSIKVRTKVVNRKTDQLQFEVQQTAEAKARRYAQGLDLDLAATFRAFGIPEVECTTLLTGLSEDTRRQYKENIAYVEQRIQEGKVREVTPYLLSALKENWQLAPKQKENLERRSVRHAPRLAATAARTEADNRQEEEMAAVVAAGRAHYDAVDEVEQHKLLTQFFKDFSGKRQLAQAKTRAEEVSPANLDRQPPTMAYSLFLYLGHVRKRVGR